MRDFLPAVLVLLVLLVATVALNYLAALGVAALDLRHLLGFTGSGASVPLDGFVFLPRKASKRDP